MRKTLDLNCAPIDQYPATKVLTESDLTTSQLVLPRPSVEEFIVPNMPRNLRERLAEDGRADIWLVDDENRLEHLSTMVHHDCIYSITGWNHVHESRPLREGDEVRFGWMDEKLHFIITFEGQSLFLLVFQFYSFDYSSPRPAAPAPVFQTYIFFSQTTPIVDLAYTWGRSGWRQVASASIQCF